MNINKAIIKEDTLLGVGAKVEEFLEQAEHGLYMAKGAAEALHVHATKNIPGMIVAAKEEFEKKEIPLDTQELVIGWFQKIAVATQNYVQHFRNQEISRAGEISAYKLSHDYIKKIVDADRKRLDALKKALEEGLVVENEDGSLETLENDSRRRQAGVRPGLSIAQQRKAEADKAEDPKEKKDKQPKKKQTTKKKGRPGKKKN